MPLGNMLGGNKKGIMYNAATKKVVSGGGISDTGTAGGIGNPSTTSPLNPGVSSPGMASPHGGVMGALAKATSSAQAAQGGLAGLYNKTQAGVTSGQPAQPSPFSYDPTTDPVYQKALAAAKANAQVQQGNDVAYLNKRGLLGSDAGNAEIAQIGQNAVSGLEANLLPQLASQAYNRYRDDINQKNTDQQTAIQQGELTGYYESPEMKQQYAAVNQAKADYANAKTPEERLAAHNKAEAARSVIAQLGGDASLVGSDKTAGQATAAQGHYGIKTAAQAQADITNARNDKLDKRDAESIKFSQGMEKAAMTGFMPDGTATNAKQQQDLTNLWTQADKLGTIPDKLADMLGLKRGTQTQEAYQYAQGLAQQNVDNLWTQADKLGTIPDKLADLIGVPRGTQTQAAKEFAQNLALNQDSNDLAWIKEDNNQAAAANGGGTPAQTVSGTTAGQMLGQSLTKVVGYTMDDHYQKTVPKYGKITDPEARENAFVDAVKTTGVTGKGAIEMLTKAGYTTKEIAALKSAYPEVFQ